MLRKCAAIATCVCCFPQRSWGKLTAAQAFRVKLLLSDCTVSLRTNVAIFLLWLRLNVQKRSKTGEAVSIFIPGGGSVISIRGILCCDTSRDC